MYSKVPIIRTGMYASSAVLLVSFSIFSTFKGSHKASEIPYFTNDKLVKHYYRWYSDWALLSPQDIFLVPKRT